jgi:catechol 2,3-dioxygenase-like lactoylglutathione lyase family enzyme
VRIFETVIYGDDIAAMAGFYADGIGLRLAEEPDDLSAVFRLDDDAMLLIFDPARSSLPGRPVPSHGAHGGGHVAFRVDPAGLDACAERLRHLGVEIEQEVDRGAGGRGLYVRDPAGNSVELMDGDPWPR